MSIIDKIKLSDWSVITNQIIANVIFITAA